MIGSSGRVCIRFAWCLGLLAACSSSPGVAPEKVNHLERRLGDGTRQWFVTPLLPAEAALNGTFGRDVAISGTTAVVAEQSASVVYVFVRSEQGWEGQRLARPPGAAAAQVFGHSVAISRDTLVVGAPSIDCTAKTPGAAYVYERSGATWGDPVTLPAQHNVCSDGFGSAVAIDGDTIVVGAPTASVGVPTQAASSQGMAYVFTRSGASWAQTKDLIASDGATVSRFGDSVAISGQYVLVGSPHWPGYMSGAAYLYSRTDWQERKLRPSDTDSNDELGFAVALSAELAVVGARYHRGRGVLPGGDGSIGYRRGAVFVYSLSDTEPAPAAHVLLPEDSRNDDAFGIAVGVSSSTIMIGASGADSVYLFDAVPPEGPVDVIREGAVGVIGDRGRLPYFGGALGLDGDIAVIGVEQYAGAYVAELLGIDGSSCDSNLDCASRQCVAGVCCNVDCSGACETCTSGTCLPLPRSAGTPSCAPYVCGESGGACPGECTGHHDCVETHSCRAERCVARGANGERCREARDCVSGRCMNEACAGRLGLGERCERLDDCESGFCVDGFCCDQGCQGQCEACDTDEAPGVCSEVVGAPHGDRAACEGAGTACGGACDGEHSASCVYPPSDTECGASCREGIMTDSTCNGQGRCEAREPRSCGNFTCADEFGCKTSCLDIVDCLSGFTCQEGRCEPSATCLDDETAQGVDGLPRPCSPFLCKNGSCRTTCDDPDDCVADSACDSKRQCVPRPANGAPSVSRGCSLAGFGSSSGFTELLGGGVIASLFGLQRRRRRGGQSKAMGRARE